MDVQVSRDERSDQLIARLGVLDGPSPPRDLQALVDLVAQVTGTSKAAINLITSRHQHQVATHGFPPSVCRREDSMCAAILNETASVVVPDALADARFRDNPFVSGAIGDVRFYASAPLITSDGVAVGRLCIFDTQPHQLTAEQESGLTVLADRVVDALELRLRGRELEDSLAELTAVQEELRRSNGELAHFAAQVSHDLRSPLTAVLANAELLSQEPDVADQPELRPLADGILSASRRMGRLIEEILAQAVYGGTSRRDPCRLGDVVDGVLTDLQPLLNTAGADVRVAPLPIVPGDPDQLYSVFLNLITNSVKYARPGHPPVVRISAEECLESWRVTVSDNGVGITSEERSRVFELYTRGVSVVDGTGIGLATARRIVRAHGGDMGVAEQPPPGTSIWFDLPG